MGDQIRKAIGKARSTRCAQFVWFVVAPADTMTTNASRHCHRHVELSVADHHGLEGLGPGFGKRGAQHRRMRLGRMAVGSLQRDEMTFYPVAGERDGQAAIRLAGGNAQQPAGRLQRCQPLGNAGIKRFRIECPVHPHAMKLGLEFVRQGAVESRIRVGRQDGHRLNRAQANDPPGLVACRSPQPVMAKGNSDRPDNIGLSVNQRPVAVENGKARHARRFCRRATPMIMPIRMSTVIIADPP